VAKDDGLAERSIDPASQEMLLRVKEKGVVTIWDRYQAQTPVCKFGRTGVCCRILRHWSLPD